MRAKIYRPSKAATQSGRNKLKSWVLELELESARVPEKLMGWVSSVDTNNQIKITFPDQESAEKFAKHKALDYRIVKPQDRRPEPKSYVDNFN